MKTVSGATSARPFLYLSILLLAGADLYQICYNLEMDKIKIYIPQPQLDKLCKQYHIRRLSFFGSVLRDDFNSSSDVDVLVEFEEGHIPGLGFIDIQDDLSRLLEGREVDLVTPKFLNHRIRDRVLKDARVVYGAN